MPRILKLNDAQIKALNIADTELSGEAKNEVVLTDATLALMADALRTNGVQMSDSDGLFFQRQLEAIETTTYDVLYPDLEARECFVTNTFGGAGVTTLTYRSYDRVGKAQVINARATDLPKSDISGKEYSIGVKTVGTAYDFDIDEVAAAQVTGMPLEARRAMASKRGYEEFINDSVWYGNDDFNGFFTPTANGGYLDQNVVATGTGGTEWGDTGSKTPDEVLADLFSACNDMVSSTKKIHQPNELLLPVSKYLYIQETPRNDVSDTTILEFFLANQKFISADGVKMLNAIEGRGTGGTECFIVMNAKTPEGTETIRIRETLPLQFLPVQLQGLVYEVPGRGRFAGLEVTYPSAISIKYGI